MWFHKEGQKPMWIEDSRPKVKPISEELREAVEREDYERAAVLRDRINARRNTLPPGGSNDNR